MPSVDEKATPNVAEFKELASVSNGNNPRELRPEGDDIAYVGVSLGLPYYRGEYIPLLVDGLMKVGCGNIIFIIPDELRIINFLKDANVDIKGALEKAVKSAQDFVMRVLFFLKKYSSHVDIFIWDKAPNNVRYVYTSQDSGSQGSYLEEELDSNDEKHHTIKATARAQGKVIISFMALSVFCNANDSAFQQIKKDIEKKLRHHEKLLTEVFANKTEEDLKVTREYLKAELPSIAYYSHVAEQHVKAVAKSRTRELAKTLGFVSSAGRPLYVTGLIQEYLAPPYTYFCYPMTSSLESFKLLRHLAPNTSKFLRDIDICFPEASRGGNESKVSDIHRDGKESKIPKNCKGKWKPEKTKVYVEDMPPNTSLPTPPVPVALFLPCTPSVPPPVPHPTPAAVSLENKGFVEKLDNRWATPPSRVSSPIFLSGLLKDNSGNPDPLLPLATAENNGSPTPEHSTTVSLRCC